MVFLTDFFLLVLKNFRPFKINFTCITLMKNRVFHEEKKILSGSQDIATTQRRQSDTVRFMEETSSGFVEKVS